MGIYKLLEDYGEVDYSAYYNGPLTDYVNSHDDCFAGVFKRVLEITQEVNLYRNFELTLNHELLSNKKIGYRDVAKIPTNTVKVPYIIYFKNGEREKAIVLSDKSYIESRGIYYCLTEPENTFEQERADIVAAYISNENADEIVKLFEEMYNNTNSCGFLQRKLDARYMNDVEEMKSDCIAIAHESFEKAVSEIDAIEDKDKKAEVIYQVVGKAFILKKALYVRYMTNKHLLNDRHGGNIVEQRKFAKAYADEVEIIPYYELWNRNKETSEQQ